jgi:hypothetical protein
MFVFGLFGAGVIGRLLFKDSLLEEQPVLKINSPQTNNGKYFSDFILFIQRIKVF